MKPQKEIEIKLALSPEAARKLLASKRFRRLAAGPPVRRHLVTTYFDTPRHALHKAGIALRVRDDGESRVQAVKLPAHGMAGLTNRTEVSTPVSGDRPELELLREAGVVPALARRRDADLAPVFTTRLERTALRLKTRHAEVELAIDRGVIQAPTRAGLREEAICEAEFELLSGDATALFGLALDVCQASDARPMYVSKSDRGYALARLSHRPKAEKARPAVLSKNMLALDAFDAVVRATLLQLERNHAPMLDGHPESVHQVRVALRRLRAALRAFKPLLPYHERKSFSSEFRWFQRRLAAARDWHVFASETVPLLMAEATAGGALQARQAKRLQRLAQYERRRATDTAVARFRSRRYARLLLMFQRWVAGLQRDFEDSEMNRRAMPFARKVLRADRRGLLEEERPLGQLPGEAVHELRKRCKSARYTAESFGSLWAGDGVNACLGAMEEFQDRLGEANDARAAVRLACGLRAGRLEPGVVAWMQGWAEKRALERIDAASESWRRLRRLKPFWEAGPGRRLRSQVSRRHAPPPRDAPPPAGSG
ncbi:MAG TPA: CYTH and CHAD domain-containing protein [Woeseiaceae bacterium]|nr:CYTH and CHAD domain-containing protein [Woeseiaceae bacterium]